MNAPTERDCGASGAGVGAGAGSNTGTEVGAGVDAGVGAGSGVGVDGSVAELEVFDPSVGFEGIVVPPEELDDVSPAEVFGWFVGVPGSAGELAGGLVEDSVRVTLVEPGTNGNSVVVDGTDDVDGTEDGLDDATAVLC